MVDEGFAAASSVRRLALGGLFCAGLAICSANPAASQEIQPYEFTPLPAGTNLAIGYYIYGHNDEFSVANGPTIRNAKLEVNVGVGRYVHFFNPIAGMPVGIQIIQPFGFESGANIGGQRVGSAFGAQNITLSAFVFPYVNTATKTNTNITAFLYPPTGTYDRNSPINLGSNRWEGDIQLGLTQGFGEHIGLDLEFDAHFYGDNNQNFPPGTRSTQNPTYRVQVWGNYRWTPAFTTSIGYEGFFGGDQRVNGFLDGNQTSEHRVRANAALFLTPRLQTMLELNHDLTVTGGFKQDFGAQVRVLYAF